MASLASALTVLTPVIEAVSALPFNGNGLQEKIDGLMDFDEEGVWVFAFEERYTYPENGYDDRPLSSAATITLGIQARRKTLDALQSDKPQNAMAQMTNALREALQIASAAGTFRSSNPSFSVRFVDSEQIFSNAVGLGVIQARLELKGFD